MEERREGGEMSFIVCRHLALSSLVSLRLPPSAARTESFRLAHGETIWRAICRVEWIGLEEGASECVKEWRWSEVHSHSRCLQSSFWAAA